MLKLKITVRATGEHTVRVPVVAAGAGVLTSVGAHSLESIKVFDSSMSPDGFSKWLDSIESVAVRHLVMVTGRQHGAKRFGDRAALLHTLQKKGAVSYDLIALNADEIDNFAEVLAKV